MTTLYLNGEFNIYEAAARKPEILAVLADAESEINLAGVTEIDGAGLQLLMLAKREAVAAGRVLRLTEHSAAVQEILELTGMVSEFGDPILLVGA